MKPIYYKGTYNLPLFHDNIKYSFLLINLFSIRRKNNYRMILRIFDPQKGISSLFGYESFGK